MSREALTGIINRAVADYGFRLAVMWGTGDVASGFGLSPGEARVLAEVIVPELKELPNPVEPDEQPAVRDRLARLAL